MSALKGKVGQWELEWKSIPRGPEGTAQVKLASGESYEVRWKRDASGIWVEFPHGVYGFDIAGEVGDEGGVSYQVSRRGGADRWDGLHFARAGEEQAAAGAAGKKKTVRVRAQMPGKIVRVLVQAGAEVEKNQPLLVMEAMKMENEIRAPQAGRIGQLKVKEGQAVESGADLLILE